MKKILLINPAYKGEVLWDVRQMPPLGLGILAALTPEEYEIKIVDENVSDLNFNEDVNLVAITSMTYNAPRAYKIAQIYKEKNIPVIMGGIHVSMLPNEALKYCSTVIIGEAENIWKQILKEFESGRLQQIYKGSSASLDDVPFPRRDLFSKKYKIQIVQASRGCPFSCEFCSVSKFANGEYKRRPVANVIKEISMLKDKRFVFADDNLMGYGKSSEQYLMNLFKDLKHLNKKWGTQLSWNIADNDNILKHAAESGAMGFFVGFESINEATLKGMGKGINLKMGIKNYKRLIKKIHDYGISVTGAFIFGNDEDEKSTFRKTLD
ncbi:MAG: B12-binding domain-containing radical SAM protein, partial [Nanoarchaeota archaeon]|nr:B12-binding domain-containing radical SAM protein [Nanoarchaeota archaeon]